MFKDVVPCNVPPLTKLHSVTSLIVPYSFKLQLFSIDTQQIVFPYDFHDLIYQIRIFEELRPQDGSLKIYKE